MKKVNLTIALLVALILPVAADVLPAAQTQNPWFSDAEALIAERSQLTGETVRARNVIVFLGDGMSITTVTAARIFAGQQAGVDGESHHLSFERFAHTGLVKTYNTDAQVPDSAGTMSAIMTGVKTRIGMLGVGPQAQRGDCRSQMDNRVASFLELAEVAGWSTGVVSTARLTHATPAATYAKAVDRGWEDDSDMPAAVRAAGCEDIAAQFLSLPERLQARYGVATDGIDVAFGGGRRHFLPADAAFNSRDASSEVEGDRTDGRNLIAEWRERYPDGSVVFDQRGFDAIDPTDDGPVLGLFSESHMRYENDRLNDPSGEPSLPEMTRKAIEILEARESNGFFLMVEAGRIDHAHHAGNAFNALNETRTLSDAVAVARAMTREDETLILVTADHGHVLSMAGYAPRGNPILGLARDGDNQPILANDGLPYTTLSYANGPGMRFFADAASPDQAPRRLGAPRAAGADLSELDTTDPGFYQQSLVPLPSETHSGGDVALYGSGPGASDIGGVIEQNAIFDLMVRASGVKP